MSYGAYEVLGGKPIELVVLTVGATVYRFTSSDAVVTLVAVSDPNGTPLDGDYAPHVLAREAIEASDERTSGDVEFVMDRDNPFVAEFLFDRAPVEPVLCQWYRYQRDDAGREVIAFFDGEVTSFAFEQAQVRFHCTPTQAVLKRTIPVVVVKPTCNHTLFDAGCTLDRAAFAVAGTVAGLSFAGGTFTIPEAALSPDGYFTRGELVAASGRRAAIIGHVGDQVTVLLPFPEGHVAVGEAVTLYPGCDGRRQTCVTTFNNLPNFLAFDQMPLDDPFRNPQQ